MQRLTSIAASSVIRGHVIRSLHSFHTIRVRQVLTRTRTALVLLSPLVLRLPFPEKSGWAPSMCCQEHSCLWYAASPPLVSEGQSPE